MLQGQQLFDDVVREVKNWVPSQDYDHESKFQNELKDYLDGQLNSGGGGLMRQQKDIPVHRERGRSNADLAVDDTVGVEMKRDLSNSQTKKLRGQIEDYLDSYNFVVIVACGIQDTSGWRELKNKYQGQQGFDGGQVEFVWKKKENYGADDSQGQQGGQDPLGGGFL